MKSKGERIFGVGIGIGARFKSFGVGLLVPPSATWETGYSYTVHSCRMLRSPKQSLTAVQKYLTRHTPLL